MFWLDMATGFTGALTLVFVLREALRRLGMMPSASAYFSPKGGCQDAVVRALRSARREILVQAQRCPAEALTTALIEAKKRGVEVEILLDAVNERDRANDLKALADQGLAPTVDASHPAAPARVIVVDQQTVITGSYDFSRKGEDEYAADVVILSGHAELAQAYRQNFLAHKGHGRTAQAKAAEGGATPKKAA